MKTASKTVGFSVGATVVVSDDYLDLFESTWDLRNVICEVVDVRRYPGGYAYKVAPVGNPARVIETYATDLRAVG